MTAAVLGRVSGPRAQRGFAARLAALSASGKALIIAAEVLLLLIIWELAVSVFGWINSVFLPSPLDIAAGLGQLIDSGVLAQNAMVSVQSWLTGFALAIMIGLPIGLLMGTSVPMDRVVGPIAWTIYATPAVAYQPLSKAWFGFGTGPVIFLVAISAVFPLLLNVAAGIRTTNPSLLRAARVYGARRIDLYTKVYLPSTVPFLFAGLRQGAVMATIGLIVAELTGSSVGMGALIMKSANTYHTDQSFAAIMVVVIWSVGMTQVVTGVERLVAPWTRERRSR
jgi:ABC-type nitrate/sulfonate/bicarbonate transport system permease component